MRYKNKRTGITIDVNSKISGGDWISVEEVAEKEEAAEKESEEVIQEETDTQDVEENQEEEEYVEEEVDLEEMTIPQLDDFAKEQGIKLTTKDKKNKDTRIDAIVAAFE